MTKHDSHPPFRWTRLVLHDLRHPFRIERSQMVYPSLLFRLILLSAMYPLLAVGDHVSMVWSIALWMVLLGAVSVCADSAREERAARILFWIALGCGVIERAAHQLTWVDDWMAEKALAVASFSYMLLFALVARVMLRDIFRSGRVDVDKITGSICFYVVLGLGFAHLFAIVQLALPGVPFHYATLNAEQLADPLYHNHAYAELIYFSFVTMTTLGFGDVTPVSALARMLVVGEALIGQIYLTVLVARLIGLHIAQAAGSVDVGQDVE